MLNVRQILVSAIVLALVGVGLTACGQRGGLYLPTDPAAKGRATLPGLLLPDSASTGGTGSSAASPAAQAPAAASSAPAGGAK
jgi:predicted small lipoprotein YifL